MPFCHTLLEHGEFGQVLVCNAGHVANVPGRKSGSADAERLAQPLECGLQDAGIKIDSAASSIAARSGRAMIEALIDGERHGAVLADLAIGRMRAKIADLPMALEGRLGGHHVMLHLDHLETMIAGLDARIEAMMQPFRAGPDRRSGRCACTLARHGSPGPPTGPDYPRICADNRRGYACTFDYACLLERISLQ